MRSPAVLKDLIRNVLSVYSLEGPVKQHSSVQHWDAVVEPEVRTHTRAVLYSGGKLMVEVDSSVLRHELLFRREEYRARINQRVGEPVVSEIVFTTWK
jgi:predicted nucleic acid-binding Zn ribbon protein